MLDDIFDLSNMNVIQDAENFYFFRALNNGDYADITSGVTADGNIINRIRTDLERYDGNPLYKENDEISLEEIHDHIKYVHRKDTNCISFSTNTNVSLNYGMGYYHNQYIMIKVPKKDMNGNGFWFAAKIIIEEINKRINNILEDGSITAYVRDNIEKIDKVSSKEELLEFLKEYSLDSSNNYSFNKAKYYDIMQLNEKQNLEKHKIAAKLDILNRRLLSRSSNKMLLETLKFAFTSSEMLHYGNLEGNYKLVSPITIELFSILQQAKTIGLDPTLINELELKILAHAENDTQLAGEKYGDYNTKIRDIPDSLDDLKISDIYELTNGKIPYTKAKKALSFSKSLATAKIRVNDLCDLLKEISNDSKYNELIDNIREKCYVLDPSFITVNKQIGLQLSDSLCININAEGRNVFSMSEQESLLDYINSLSSEEKEVFIQSNGLELEKKLCDLINTSTDEDISLNRYYAELILDCLDLNEIYANSYLEKSLSKDERQTLISYLDKADCMNMFESLKELNLEPKVISTIIFNFLLNNGYQGQNFIDLSLNKEFKDIVSNNLENINSTISAIRLDYLLGIRDNDNRVLETELVLRDYQQLAVDKVDNIFNTKNFAGVVLPTGAGKSFVAIAEMLKHKDQNILYYAPNREILRQIQKHIVKYVLNLSIIPESKENYYLTYPEEIPEGYIFLSDVEEMIKSVLPQLKMYCYQGLTTKEDEFFENRNAGLIVLDEVHRTGALEWNEKIELLLEKNPKAKILGITATPIRDVDQQNMVEKLAMFSGSYTKDEIIKKKYMAAEMYLVDAMQEGIVVTPNIVTFDYLLGESSKYKEALELYEKETDPLKKEQLKKAYDKMRDIVKKSQNYDISKIIKESFDKNNKSNNGRYIIFLPVNSTGEETEKYILDQIEDVKKYFKEIDPEPEVEYLLSNRKQKSANASAISRFENESDHLKLLFAINMLNEGVHVDGIDGVMMLRPLSAGNKILYYQQIGRCIYSLDPNHELTPSEFPLIFDVYNNCLEQNIDRQINRHTITSDLQHMELISDWISKHFRFPDINSESLDEAKKAVTLKRIQKKYARYIDSKIQRTSLTETEMYEVEEIIRIGLSIDLWEHDIPERVINKTYGEENVDRISNFEVKGEQKKFLELFKSMTKVSSADSYEIREAKLVSALNILDVLAEYDVPIDNKTITKDTKLKDIYDALPRDILELVKNSISEDDDFEIGEQYNEVKKSFYYGKPIFLNYDIHTLRKMGVFEPFSTFFQGELDSSINKNWFIEKGPRKYLNLNIRTGTYFDENGFDIKGVDEKNFTQEDGFINKYGFGRDGYYYEIDEDGQYIKTDSIYNPNGFDIKGDYYELQEDGTYKNLGKLDTHGFNIDGYFHKYNSITNKYVNTGYVLDENYFDKDGLYWGPIGDNIGYKKRLLQYSDGATRIFEEVDYYTRNDIRNKTKPNQSSRILTSLPYDLNYFDRDGYYYVLNEKGERVKSKLKYNDRFLDRDGYYYELTKNGTRIKTDRMYDDNFYGLDGHYYKLNKNGERVKSDYVADVDRINYPGLIIVYRHNESLDMTTLIKQHAFDREGYYYEVADGKLVKVEPPTKISKYGFDKDGYYHEKLPDGTRNPIASESSIDIYGFDETGYCKDGLTGLVNKDGFSQDGYYWVKNKKKKNSYVKTYSKKNEYGFDIDGLYDFKLSNGTTTKRIYNNRFLDKDGFYYKRVEKPDGTFERVKTNKKTDIRGFALDGTHYSVFVNRAKDEYVYKEPKLYDQYGFDVDGIYYEIPYIRYLNGTDRLLNSKRIKTDPPRIYDNNHFNFRGFYCEVSNGEVIVTDSKYDPSGYDRDGLGKDGYNRYGYDKAGYNKEGYNRYGYDKDGYNKEGYDQNGYNKEGINSEGYNREGYNKDGYNKDGYDRYGYNKDGYDRDRKDKNGNLKSIIYEYDEEGYDQYGFNKEGIHKITKLKYDPNYFRKDGINIITGTLFSLTGHDIDGYYNDKKVSLYAKESVYVKGEGNILKCVYLARRVLNLPYSSRDNVLDEVSSAYTDKKSLRERLYTNIIAAAVLDPSIKEQLTEYVLGLLKEIESLSEKIKEEKTKSDKDDKIIREYQRKMADYREMIRKTEIGEKNEKYI